MEQKKIITILVVALVICISFIILTHFWDFAYTEGYKAGAQAVLDKIKAMQ